MNVGHGVLYYSGRAEICSAEDISISGVLLKQRYLEEALSIIHFLHSDSIGAPKVEYSILLPPVLYIILYRFPM